MAASAGYAQISIHASHKGSDVIGSGLLSGNVQFQSTLPAREATTDYDGVVYVIGISIHASRKGSDTTNY